MAKAAYETSLSSSYRVKFRKNQFMDLVRLAQPQRTYKVKNVHFAFDGFIMYCQECMDHDFGQRVVEFSNAPCSKS